MRKEELKSLAKALLDELDREDWEGCTVRELLEAMAACVAEEHYEDGNDAYKTRVWTCASGN